jgi:catechol 2,3-dioxygenase-like lactoylglutathione lyase family enzyme
MTSLDLERIEEERRRIADTYLTQTTEPSSARGIHHLALISSDVERTVRFYQELLGFPMLEIFENRDYRGSSHFFFNVGNGNSIAFFDFPGLDLGPYAEVLGGLHHIAISMEPEKWQRIREKLDEAGIEYMVEGEVSMYFSDPDGVRLELIADPLGEMYGNVLLEE